MITTNYIVRCNQCGRRLAVNTEDHGMWCHVDSDGEYVYTECVPDVMVPSDVNTALWCLAVEIVGDQAKRTTLVHEHLAERSRMAEAAETAVREVTEQRDALAESLEQAHQLERELRNALRLKDEDITVERNALRHFKDYVVQTVVDYSQGCWGGKRDFISELGLEWPTEDYVVLVKVTLPVGEQDEALGAYADRLRTRFDDMTGDGIDLIEVDWETL